MVTTEKAQPGAEGPCDHCHQTRALFRYDPAHSGHLGGFGFGCEWCTRERQPLLCVRCYSAEAEREEVHPDLIKEAELRAQIDRDNARAEFARADRLAKEASR